MNFYMSIISDLLVSYNRFLTFRTTGSTDNHVHVA